LHQKTVQIRQRLNANTEIQEVPAENGNRIELQETSAYSTALQTNQDPYVLKRGLKTEEELTTLKESRKKKAERFYERQNTLIGDLLRPLDEHVENAKAEAKQNRLPVGFIPGFRITVLTHWIHLFRSRLPYMYLS
jgi:hypothetical protein